MIDITTIQANPIPMALRDLQNLNSTLLQKNKIMESALIFIGVILIVTIAYKTHKPKIHNEER